MMATLADSQPTIEIDTVAFEAGMQRIRDGVVQGLINPDYGTVTVQMRLLAERCQDFTPPRDKAQGEVAIMRDLTRIYYPISASTFTDKRLKQIVKTDNRPAWDAAAARFGSGNSLRNTRAVGFSEEWHRKNRNRRGRAVAGKYGNLGVVTLGPEGAKARDYMKQVKKRVGWAKAGWNMGIIPLGGRVRQSWVSRHSISRGQLIDGRRDPNPWLRVINDTGWAKSGVGQQEGERIVRNAVAARARDMQAYADQMVRVAVAKAGAGESLSLAS